MLVRAGLKFKTRSYDTKGVGRQIKIDSCGVSIQRKMGLNEQAGSGEEIVDDGCLATSKCGCSAFVVRPSMELIEPRRALLIGSQERNYLYLEPVAGGYTTLTCGVQSGNCASSGEAA